MVGTSANQMTLMSVPATMAAIGAGATRRSRRGHSSTSASALAPTTSAPGLRSASAPGNASNDVSGLATLMGAPKKTRAIEVTSMMPMPDMYPAITE